MIIKKIISGGQIGADQGGLFAASKFGISTGGFAPEGWLTLNGPNPKLLKDMFGLVELPGGGYKQRTWANVIVSDATIRFAVDFNSPGECCTMNAIKYSRKPHFDIDLGFIPKDLNSVVDWIIKNNVVTLNVAGNSEGKRGYTDILERTYFCMCDILSIAARKS